MEQHRKILAELALEKCEKALQDAFANIDTSLPVAQNRAYYAVFYIVSALAYVNDFMNKSHHKLMGQFNKRYIYENSVFDKSLVKIYSALIINRQLSDYNFAFQPKKDLVSKDVSLAKKFIDDVKPYVLKRMEEIGQEK